MSAVKGGKKKISDEVRQQIAIEPADCSLQSIARKYDVSWHHVKKIRTEPHFDTGIAPARESSKTYDRAIEAIEEQLVMFQSALNVLQGLRDIERGL